MNRTLFLVWIVMLFANRATFGQPIGGLRAVAPVGADLGVPTITIVAAPTGILVRRLGANNASLDLGRVSYFQAISAPGQSVRKSSRSLVISTRFGLRVDCPGISSTSRVNVTMSRLDSDGSYAISIDGITLGSTPQPLLQSMSCDSGSEHRLDVVVPISTQAGPIESNIAFAATLNR
jgi:hypothetical protein